MRVSTKIIDSNNHQEEEEGKRDFPPKYIEIKEGDRKIKEKKDPKWMDAQIKTKEVNILANDHPKLEKI